MKPLRKPTDIVQPNLRIREALRRRLEREAKAARRSLNQELICRLEASFEQEAMRSLEMVAADLRKICVRMETKAEA
jgi:Arc-like DNA binding domain